MERKLLALTGHAVRDLSVGRSAGQQLDDRARERPDVRLGRRALELDHLGRHPVRRARHVLHLALHRTQVQRDTEVGQLDVPVLRGEDVRSFEVTMYDVIAVQII